MAFRKILLFVFLSLALVLIGATASVAEAAEPNDQCLQCHSNKGFSIEKEGKTVSLYVDSNELSQSVHGTNDCQTCHAGMEDIPHKETVSSVRELAAKVTERCQVCHADVNKEYKDSTHGKLAAEGQETAYCSDCHGAHTIVKTENENSLVNRTNITETCTKCHSGEIAESYVESFHGKAVNLGSTKAATCVDCHTDHMILGPTEPKSTVSKANVPETCASCHNTAQPNFAVGSEHWTFEPDGPGKPMYYTLKFFTWLTIATIVLLIVHIELDLFRKYKNAGKK